MKKTAKARDDNYYLKIIETHLSVTDDDDDDDEWDDMTQMMNSFGFDCS